MALSGRRRPSCGSHTRIRRSGSGNILLAAQAAQGGYPNRKGERNSDGWAPLGLYSWTATLNPSRWPSKAMGKSRAAPLPRRRPAGPLPDCECQALSAVKSGFAHNGFGVVCFAAQWQLLPSGERLSDRRASVARAVEEIPEPAGEFDGARPSEEFATTACWNAAGANNCCRDGKSSRRGGGENQVLGVQPLPRSGVRGQQAG